MLQIQDIMVPRINLVRITILDTKTWSNVIVDDSSDDNSDYDEH